MLPLFRDQGGSRCIRSARTWTRSCLSTGPRFLAAAFGGLPGLAERLRLVPAVAGTWNHRPDYGRVPGKIRFAEGRDPQPSVAVIDSQSVRAPGTVGRDTRGYDAGKKSTA